MHSNIASALVAAAAFLSTANAVVTVGNNQYGFSAGVGTIATDVPAVYVQGKRPVRSSEWPAIVTAGGANLATDLGASGAAVIWDDSNGQFVTVDVANPNAAPVVTAATANNPGLLVLANAAKACPVTSSSPVNILDTYPGITFTDELVDSCLCFSQFSGDLCNQYTTAVNCPNATVAAMTANTGQQVIKNGTDGGSINGLMETVEFEINSPQVQTRNYTTFSWGSCLSGAQNSNAVLRKFVSSTAQSDCNDGFQFGYLVSQLRDTCGLQQGNFEYDGTPQGRANTSWVRYRGDLMINYVEMVGLSLNNGTATQSLTRTGRLVTPIDVYILRQYEAELTTNTSITVVSPFQLKAAVTATNVKNNQTTATVDITFGISNPYEIKWISNEYTGDGGLVSIPGVQWQSNNGVPDISAAYVINPNTSVIVTDPRVNQTSNAGLAPCAPADFDANGFCWRTIRVLIIVDTACTLDHTFTFNTIAVGCTAQYQGVDCPLQGGEDTTSSAQFTVRAADFCDGQRALVINGAVVIKAYVPQRNLSRTDATPMRSYIINDKAWLTLFIDAEKSLKVFQLTPLTFQSKIGTTGTYTTPTNAAQYIADSTSGAPGWDNQPQGFDVATQTHAMAVTLDCNFVLDSNNQCLLNPGGLNGASSDVFTRLTFTVDYEPQNAGRRRRRQAANDRGYAAVDAQSSVQPDQLTAEAAPSAASGVSASSTLIAVVAASLLAVLLA